MYMKEAGQKSREELVFLYRSLVEFFPEIPFLLFYGTLLGYVREGDFLMEDNDIDVLLPRSYRDKVLEICQTMNFRVGISNDEIHQIYVDEIGPFDIYFYEDRGEDILIRWDGNLLFSKKDIFPLQTVEFHGFPVKIPNNAEEICRQVYGDQWRIPLRTDEYEWGQIQQVRFATQSPDSKTLLHPETPSETNWNPSRHSNTHDRNQ